MKITNTHRIFAVDHTRATQTRIGLPPRITMMYFTEAAAVDPNADLYILFAVEFEGSLGRIYTHLYGCSDRSIRLACTGDKITYYGKPTNSEGVDRDLLEAIEESLGIPGVHRTPKKKKSWVRRVLDLILNL